MRNTSVAWIIKARAIAHDQQTIPSRASFLAELDVLGGSQLLGVSKIEQQHKGEIVRGEVRAGHATKNAECSRQSETCN